MITRSTILLGGRNARVLALGLFGLSLLLLLLGALAAGPAQSPPAQLGRSGARPLAFEPNAGQTDSAVRFLAHSRGGLLFFTPAEVVLTLAGPGAATKRTGSSARFVDNHAPRTARPEDTRALATLRIQFIGAAPAPSLQPGRALPGRVNYLKGGDPARWLTGLPTYEGFTYTNLYPGVDLIYSGVEGQLKGTYIVAPGADPARIQWHYSGVENITLDAAGQLRLTPRLISGTAAGDPTILESAPVAWQEIDGRRVAVPARYTIQAGERVGFHLGAYDRTRPLTIDPTLTYATYLGGFYGDSAVGIALDGAGNIYIGGTTSSSDFPLAGTPFQPVYGGDQYDMFAAKLSADGATLIYSTFMGGNGWDVADFVAVDAAGTATLGGWTTSTNFPTTPGAFQTTFAGTEDVAVAKLNSSGSGLIFGSYWGGGGVEEPYGFAVDGAGNTYFTGYFFPGFSSWAFVSALSADGTQQLFYHELGGVVPGPGDQNANSSGEGLAVDGAGNIYVTGYTRAADFPTTAGAYRTTIQAYEDGFATKLAPGGQTILYSTYIPGGVSEYPADIALDQGGNAYITGNTSSSDYPTTAGAFQTACGDPRCAFVTKLNPAGAALVYSTFLGGPAFYFDTEDYGVAVRVNPAGNAYVSGYTSAPDFPVVHPLQATLNGPADAFLTKFNPTGTGVEYSTYLGGSGGDFAEGLALGSGDTVYLAGTTSSTDFPVVNPLQPTNHGQSDAFIAIIAEATGTPAAPTRTGTPPTATPTACLPGVGTWRNEPPLNLGRDYPIAAVAAGKFYLIGGVHTGWEPPYVATVERFDPASNSWDTVAPLPVAAQAMAAAALGNKIYVAGGFTVRQGFTIDLLQIYDVTTNSWSQGHPLPAPTSGAAAAAYNGKIYIFGGGESMARNTVYEYDPATDTYTSKAPMPTVEDQIGAATLGNRIYVMGGFRHDQYTHYVYDPTADTWTTTATPLTPSFAWPGVFALNSELWVVGGYDNFTQQGYPPSQEVQIYNPASNSWRFGPVFNTPRTRSRAAEALNGRGYVAGGMDLANPSVYLTSLESIGPNACPTGTPPPATAVATVTPASSATAATTGTPASSATPGLPSPSPTVCALQFTDVDPANPFYAYIKCLACRGIVNGYSSAPPCAVAPCFLPGANVTRGQMSKFVANAANYTDAIPSTQQTFTDVPYGSPFWLYVERAYAHGVISGYTSSPPCITGVPCFLPANSVTRGQTAKFVANAANYDDPISSTRQTFTDVPTSSPFWLYVERVYLHGVIAGYSTNPPCTMGVPCFLGGNAVTRGQTAKFIANAFFPNCQTPQRP